MRRRARGPRGYAGAGLCSRGRGCTDRRTNDNPSITYTRYALRSWFLAAAGGVGSSRAAAAPRRSADRRHPFTYDALLRKTMTLGVGAPPQLAQVSSQCKARWWSASGHMKQFVSSGRCRHNINSCTHSAYPRHTGSHTLHLLHCPYKWSKPNPRFP